MWELLQEFKNEKVCSKTHKLYLRNVICGNSELFYKLSESRFIVKF